MLDATLVLYQIPHSYLPDTGYTGYIPDSSKFKYNYCIRVTHGKTHALLQHSTAVISGTMMVTVCISTDALSSAFISPDLSDTNSFHQCCWSIMPVTACSYRLFLWFTLRTISCSRWSLVSLAQLLGESIRPALENNFSEYTEPGCILKYFVAT